MRIRLLCLTVTLAAAAVAAAAEPQPCAPPKPGAWVPMALAEGPEIGEVADVKTGFLGPSKWWLWDSFQPLAEGHVFDARCNAWRRTTPARGSTLPKQLDRRHGVLFGENALAVYSPTWEAGKDGTIVSGSLGVFVLDGEMLQWTNLTPTEPPLGPDTLVVPGDGLLVAWDERAGRGALFTLATKRWEFFTERPPLVGRGYDCSWIQGGAWLVANPHGVFRFELSSKKWSTLVKPEQPMSTQELGGCLLSSSSTGLSVAMPRSAYAPRHALFIIEGAGSSAWELPVPEGSSPVHVSAAGNTLWLTTSLGTGQLQRYDRGAGKWVGQALPKGLDPRRLFLSEAQGQAMLVEQSPAQLPRPRGHLSRAAKEPTPSPSRVSLWNGKRFGRPLTLGTGDGFRDGVHSALGGLAAIDAKAIRVLDVSGKERLRLPAPPRWLAYRGFSPEALVTWGEMETRVGNDCNNPFHPQQQDPSMPVCDPSEERVFTRIHPGGFVLLRASADEAPRK